MIRKILFGSLIAVIVLLAGAYTAGYLYFDWFVQHMRANLRTPDTHAALSIDITDHWFKRLVYSPILHRDIGSSDYATRQGATVEIQAWLFRAESRELPPVPTWMTKQDARMVSLSEETLRIDANPCWVAWAVGSLNQLFGENSTRSRQHLLSCASRPEPEVRCVCFRLLARRTDFCDEDRSLIAESVLSPDLPLATLAARLLAERGDERGWRGLVDVLARWKNDPHAEAFHGETLSKALDAQSEHLDPSLVAHVKQFLQEVAEITRAREIEDDLRRMEKTLQVDRSKLHIGPDSVVPRK